MQPGAVHPHDVGVAQFRRTGRFAQERGARIRVGAEVRVQQLHRDGGVVGIPIRRREHRPGSAHAEELAERIAPADETLRRLGHDQPNRPLT